MRLSETIQNVATVAVSTAAVLTMLPVFGAVGILSPLGGCISLGIGISTTIYDYYRNYE